MCWDRELQMKMNQSPASTSQTTVWEREFKKKQKCLDKKLKNIQNEKPKVKVKDNEEEMSGADQNQNEITQEESIHIPAVPVANVFGILAEEELLTEKPPGKDTTDGEECVIGKTNEVDEADKIENGDIEEIMNRAKTKFRTNLRANIRAKIMTKPASEDLTEEETSWG